MSRTRIGFNIGTWFINNNELESMYQYMEQANPTITLFMEGFREAMIGYERQKRANPDTEPIIIYRDFATIGKDQWKDLTPEFILDKVNYIWGDSNRHIWVYLLNEPHANGEKEVKALSKLLGDSIHLLCSNGYNVVAGNFSAGTIDHPEWMHDYLYAASQWKDQVFLSEHMYAMVLPNNFGWGYRNLPSDIQGSHIFNTLPVEQSLDYMQPKYWLDRFQVQEIFDTYHSVLPSWHYGRIKQLYHYAEDELGIELPQYIATECLMDDLQDLEIINGQERKFTWNGQNKTLKRHIFDTYGSSYSQIKGDMSYDKMYQSVFNMEFSYVMTMVLSHVDRTFPEQCLGLNLFTYSNAPDWDRYGHNYIRIFEQIKPELVNIAQQRSNSWVGGKDYAKEDKFYLQFDNVYIENEDDMSAQFPVVDWSDDSFKLNKAIITGSSKNVRIQPSIMFNAIGVIANDDLFRISKNYEYKDTQYTWNAVILDNGVKGWVASSLFTYVPVEDDTPDNDNHEYVTKLELSDRLAPYGSAMQNLQNQIVDLRNELENTQLNVGNDINGINLRLNDLQEQLDNVQSVDGIIIPDESVSQIVQEMNNISSALLNLFQIFQGYENNE